MICSALNACLISALLAMSSSCSLSRSESAKTSPTEAIQIPVPPSNREEEHPALTIVHFPNEPLALLRVDLDAKRSQMTLEIQNVSDKTVRLVTYGLGVSTLCSEFMYAVIPSPRIGYGDWTAEGVKAIGSSEPALKPQQKATIIVGGDKYLADLLNPRTYSSCPEGHKKPELMLQNVYFVDGAEWRPNQQRSSRSGGS